MPVLPSNTIQAPRKTNGRGSIIHKTPSTNISHIDNHWKGYLQSDQSINQSVGYSPYPSRFGFCHTYESCAWGTESVPKLLTRPLAHGPKPAMCTTHNKREDFFKKSSLLTIGMQKGRGFSERAVSNGLRGLSWPSTD